MRLPPAPWFHSDDTEMAISIVEALARDGRIDQDALAVRFADRFQRDPDRGYGSMARIILKKIAAGTSWPTASAEGFAGEGSLGNGAAMRAAPLGALL